MASDELCREIKGSGEPCKNPVKWADGKCGIHSDINGGTEGRPTKFTTERAQLAIEAAREGKSKRGCCRAAGVARGSIGNWLDENHTFENGDGMLDTFFDAFARARATGESECIRNARREHGNPSFEKFMLSSSYGYEKTEKQKTEHSGEIETDLSISDEDAEALDAAFGDGADE